MKRRGNREGSIYKRKDGVWCGAVTLGRDYKTGKLIRKVAYGKTRAEVAEKLNKLLREYHLGLLSPHGEHLQFGQWLWTYLNIYKKPTIRETTYELYRGILNNHLPNALALAPLEKLRSEDLQRLYLELEKEGYSRLVQILHNFIHSALEQALRLGYIPRNVSSATTRPRARKKEIKVLNQEEIERFLECAKNHRLYPAFLLLLTTGLRRGELLGLEWKNINWERKTLTVERNLVYLKGKFRFEEPKTKGSYRTIPLSDNAFKVLKKWRKKWLEERIKLGADWPNTDLVFPSEAHTPMNPRNFLRTLKGILKEAGLPLDVTIHSLRHTYATMLLSQGEHPKVVQELLGHSSITTTLDVYSKVMPGLKEQAVKKLDAFFQEVLPKEEK